MPSSTAALKALITRNPLIVSAKTTVADAIAQMHQAQPNPSAGSCGDSGLQDSYHQQVRSSCVLVVEHGKLIGLLSERDVVRLSAQQVQSAEVPLAQVMAQVSISLRESSLVDASSTIALIQQHGARHLPILDQQDYPTGLLTYESLQPLLLQEMRKQQQIEALLLESEQRYASLSAIAPVGIFCADASGRCTYVNDYYCQILQSTPDALLNQSWQENLHPEDRERVMAAWESCVRENRTFRTECRLCRSDGAVVWIHNQAMMERDASGQIIGYVGAITDISDRKRAETALRQSERTNSIIVDTIPDLLIQMQRSGRYSRIAGGSAVRVKLPASSKTAERDVHTVLPPELAQQRLHYANQAIDTGRLQIYEQVFDCGDGELRNEEVRVAPLDDAEVLIIIRDITDRKQAELQLQSLVEGTAATTGQDFFPPLVSHISQALNVSCAGVSEWVEGSLQTLALWGSGELRHNTCFDPKGLPCGRTMENGSYYFEGSISKDLLETLDISLDELRSYAGVALRGSSGESMGTLFVLNEQPIQNPQRAMQ
ncbi:MAG: PAS domain S-box protein, partial [Elainellaceae cyanobacterium]